MAAHLEPESAARFLPAKRQVFPATVVKRSLMGNVYMLGVMR